MTIALWIIAIVETIRMIEQTLQLRLIAKDTGARDNAYAEFVKSLKETDREFVKRMLTEFEQTESQKCDDCIWSVCNYNKVDWERAEQTEPSSDWICDTCEYHTIERAVQCKMCGDGGQYEPKQTEPTTEDCSMVEKPHCNGCMFQDIKNWCEKCEQNCGGTYCPWK